MAERTSAGKENEVEKAKPVDTGKEPIKKSAAKKVTERAAKDKAGVAGEKKHKEKAYKITRSKESSELAREKSRLEKKKGKFKRQNYGNKLRVKNRWRRPRGIDSGHQDDEKHKPAHPRSGYMTPAKVKGLDVTGYMPIRVFNVAGLDGLNPKTQAIVIAASVGKRKRIEIQRAAQAKNIQILNYKE